MPSTDPQRRPVPAVDARRNLQELLYSKAHLMLSVNSLGDSMNRACMEGWRNNSKGNKSQDVSSEANKAGPATVEFKRQVP